MRGLLLVLVVVTLSMLQPGTSLASGEGPFTSGVASGEVTAHTVVLWTRVDQPAFVVAEVARDHDFRHIVRLLPAVAQAQTDLTVRVSVHALRPDTRYFYRFVHVALSQRSIQVQVSPTGTFRSAPHRHQARDVHFAFSGDSEAVFQPFKLLQTIQKEHPDFFVYLGDTIYADNDSGAGNVARVAPAESLAVYRAKYRENRADRALQHLLADVPLYASWDDHEVRNDFAGETVDRTLYSHGRQAFLEYMPLAPPHVPAEAPCAAAPLFRVFHWGSAVQIIVLDERSCRSADVAEVCRHDPLPTLPLDLRRLFGLLDPPPPDCLAALFDPARTMLGALQMEAFKKALLERTATFTFVINQVPIQQFWGSPYDRWEGYAAERQHLLEFIRDHHIEHVIFLTTDTHANLINDVFIDRFAAPAPVAYEFVTGPIGHPTLGHDIFAAQGDAGLAGFHALLNLAGVDCRHLDVLSYGSVDVDATTETATIMLKDDTGAIVQDQVTSVPCQKTIGPSNADQVLQHGLSESQHASGK